MPTHAFLKHLEGRSCDDNTIYQFTTSLPMYKLICTISTHNLFFSVASTRQLFRSIGITFVGGGRGNIIMLFGGWLLAWVTAVAPNISGKYLFLIFLTHLVIRIEKPFVFQLQNSKYGKCQVMNNILKFVSPVHQSKKDNRKKELPYCSIIMFHLHPTIFFLCSL